MSRFSLDDDSNSEQFNNSFLSNTLSTRICTTESKRHDFSSPKNSLKIANKPFLCTPQICFSLDRNSLRRTLLLEDAEPLYGYISDVISLYTRNLFLEGDEFFSHLPSSSSSLCLWSRGCRGRYGSSRIRLCRIFQGTAESTMCLRISVSALRRVRCCGSRPALDVYCRQAASVCISVGARKEVSPPPVALFSFSSSASASEAKNALLGLEDARLVPFCRASWSEIL